MIQTLKNRPKLWSVNMFIISISDIIIHLGDSPFHLHDRWVPSPRIFSDDHRQ